MLAGANHPMYEEGKTQDQRQQGQRQYRPSCVLLARVEPDLAHSQGQQGQDRTKNQRNGGKASLIQEWLGLLAVLAMSESGPKSEQHGEDRCFLPVKVYTLFGEGLDTKEGEYHNVRK